MKLSKKEILKITKQSIIEDTKDWMVNVNQTNTNYANYDISIIINSHKLLFTNGVLDLYINGSDQIIPLNLIEKINIRFILWWYVWGRYKRIKRKNKKEKTYYLPISKKVERKLKLTKLK